MKISIPWRPMFSTRAPWPGHSPAASIVVNAASLYREKGAATFEAFHVTAAGRMAALSREAGVLRFIQISGINAGRTSPSYYAQVRGRGEEAVRDGLS